MMYDLLPAAASKVALHDGTDVGRLLSPRPYLTASTPSGVPITEVAPDDHLHHLGVSVALPDVEGTSFWGGRTFVRERGSVMLANHGTQRIDVVDDPQPVPDGAEHRLRLSWLSQAGDVLLRERRTITVRESDGGLDVVWMSELEAARDLSLGSPETNGRDGAFYGGLFWRTPFTEATIETADGVGAERSHGSTSPWLAVRGSEAALVATTTTALPWFVRDSGYVGFCPAVAAGERRQLAAGETLRLDLAVRAVDGAITDPAAVAAALQSAMTDGVRGGT